MSAPSLRLPLCFDLAALQADVAAFQSSEWIAHFNQHYYEGEWSGIALRAVAGADVALFPNPDATTDFVDTPALVRAPAVKAVLDALACETTSVRFLKLGAGATIRRHRDYDLGLEDGEIRLHLPIRTNPDVEFLLDDQRVDLREGELWYLNFNLYHSVHNRSEVDRIHLVIDCIVNPWLQTVFAEAGGFTSDMDPSIPPPD